MRRVISLLSSAAANGRSRLCRNGAEIASIGQGWFGNHPPFEEGASAIGMRINALGPAEASIALIKKCPHTTPFRLAGNAQRERVGRWIERGKLST